MNDTLKKYTWDDVEIDEDSKFSHNKSSFSITKADSDKRLVFGWALVSARSDGEQIIDSQGDIVEQDDLEEGAYEYVLNFRDAGEEHVGSLRKKARMVESVVFTEEKMRAMGIPAGTVPVGWWIGFYVDDDRTWELIKNGTYKMFSIEGKALREPVKEPITKRVAKAFSEVFKYNDRHDPATGRFAPKGGGVAIATTATQQYTSAETSINSSKLPAVFGKVDWKPGTVNFDNGGGKFDNATEYLETKGVKNLIYDPYNRSQEHNNSVIDKISRQKADTATISNVLNVIQEKEARLEVLRNTKAALKDGGTAYITIYEGNGSGIGKPSSKGYQLNMKTKDYLSEVQEVFPNSHIQRGMIVANNSPATNTFTQVVDRRTRTAKSFYEIEKFNPYHDSKGRFATASGYASFTIRTKDPKKQHMADMAVAREKERVASQNKEAEPRRIVLDQRNKELANNWSFMRDKGGYYEKMANSELDDFRSKFKRDDLTDEQKKFLDQREEEYAKLVTDQYNDLLYRQGTNPSSMVAGPANFNTRRFERKQQAEFNSQNEFNEKKKRFTENTEKQLKGMEPEEKQIAYWRNGKWKHGETISTDDPLAEKKLSAKLEYQKETQQKMKDANAYYRKNGTMEGFSGFSESTNQKLDYALNNPNRWGEKKPFQSYELTNNNQQIKATESRLKQMQQQKATASSSGGGGGSSFNGGQIIRNTDMNRLQIKFDGIPDAATRQQLKSNGWRWSPKNGVWQRQLTANAEASAKRITDELNKSYDYELAKSFADIVKFNPYHDSKGRFSSADGAASFTYAPGKSKAHDLAIAREKERFVAGAASKDSKEQAEKRVSEAERNLKSLLNDDAEVKLTGMDPDLAESTVKSVQMVLDKYPTLKDAFGGFTTDEPEKGYFTENSGTYACFGIYSKKIHMNLAFYSDKGQLEQKYAKNVESKFHPEGTDYKAVVVHEMGHAVDRYISSMVIDRMKFLYGGETVSSRIWNSDIRAAKKKGEPMNGKNVRENLSGYAGKNSKEYFAEAFSEAMTSNSPRKTATSIMKRIDTYIKKAAVKAEENKKYSW